MRQRFEISVVVPALNEARRLGRTLACVRAGGIREIIVADGGSTDGTADIARAHGARVVRSARGRGRQLNAGAAAARGDVLLFLHADALVPQGFDRLVLRTLARRGVVAGAFGLSIADPRRTLRIVEQWVAWRSRLLSLPFGDQALFLSAETFHRAGGYPDWPALEDAALVRVLRRRGTVAVAPARVTTSARRWREAGVWRAGIGNQVCYWSWRLGGDPALLAARREAWSASRPARRRSARDAPPAPAAERRTVASLVPTRVARRVTTAVPTGDELA